MLGQKMKVTLETESGEFYELDAISTQIIYRQNVMEYSYGGGPRDYLAEHVEIEMSFRGTGDITTGVKRAMIVCIGCGSEWHDDKYHPGTCGNCGWGAEDTKRKSKKLSE